MLALGRTFDIVPIQQPLDLQTARTPDIFNMGNYGSALYVIYANPGTDGDDLVLTFEQCAGVAGSPKDLAIVSQFWKKEAATDLTGTGTWTRVTQAISKTVTVGDPSAQDAGLYAFPIDADWLDIDNGYNCVKVSIADTGSNAKLGCAFVILTDLRYPDAPEKLLSAII